MGRLKDESHDGKEVYLVDFESNDNVTLQLCWRVYFCIGEIYSLVRKQTIEGMYLNYEFILQSGLRYDSDWFICSPNFSNYVRNLIATSYL